MKVLMLVTSDVAHDARVTREAVALAGGGHSVHVIGRGIPADWTPPPGVSVSSVTGSSVLRRASGTSGTTLPAPIRAVRWALLPQHRNAVFRSWATAAGHDAQARDFDVVHAHDFTTLELGAQLAETRGARLVYDSHELWPARSQVGRPTPLQKRRERRIEARLGTAADAVVTVSEGFARWLHDRYGWRHIHVVRNTWPLSPAAATPLTGPPMGAAYAGRIAPFRDLEAIVEAARQLAPFPITLLGPADERYLAAFDPGPVRVLPARPVGEVDGVLRAHGLALVTHSDRWESYRLTLPNKLFHPVAAGVPVVATDVPEMGRVVTEHGIGVLYRPGDVASLVAAVREARARYPELVAAVARAAPLLSWDHDARVLLDLYAGLEPPLQRLS